MAEIVKLGSLYFDNLPQKSGAVHYGEDISFGPALPDFEIQWVKLKGGFLIADRCLCTNISWQQLNDQNYVSGKIIQIDGSYYLCRCLNVGGKDGAPNEWDDALDEVGESDDIWNWSGVDFWGQEAWEDDPTSRTARACYMSRNWSHYPPDSQFYGLGFRPLLEPLGSKWSTVGLIGETIQIIGPDGILFSGCLMEADDYDLTVVPTTPLPEGCTWGQQVGTRAIIDRATIQWARKLVSR